jgi:hypothetical protein
MTRRVFREIQKDHPDWLQYAPIDDDVQLQLRQLIYNNCGENSNITQNVIRMFSKMGTRGCDLWAYLLDHFGNEKPMQMLAMIEDLVRLQGGTTPLDVFIDDILQLKADIEDVLGDNPKELLSWFIFQKLYRHSDPILNKLMAKNVAVMQQKGIDLSEMLRSIRARLDERSVTAKSAHSLVRGMSVHELACKADET